MAKRFKVSHSTYVRIHNDNLVNSTCFEFSGKKSDAKFDIEYRGIFRMWPEPFWLNFPDHKSFDWLINQAFWLAVFAVSLPHPPEKNVRTKTQFHYAIWNVIKSKKLIIQMYYLRFCPLFWLFNTHGNEPLFLPGINKLLDR